MTNTEKIAKVLEGKISTDKMMAVPIMLLMIDTKTWKFQENFITPEFKEIADIIENCKELRETFGT